MNKSDTITINKYQSFIAQATKIRICCDYISIYPSILHDAIEGDWENKGRLVLQGYYYSLTVMVKRHLIERYVRAIDHSQVTLSYMSADNSHQCYNIQAKVGPIHCDGDCYIIKFHWYDPYIERTSHE